MDVGLSDRPALLEQDPSSFLRYLPEEDIYRFACCSRKASCLARMYECLYYAKLEARPHVKDWSSLGIATRGDGFSWQELRHRLSTTSVTATVVDRVFGDDLSLEQFHEEYQKKSRPVCITGLTEEWTAHHTWTFGELVDRFGEEEFRFDDNFGEKIKLYDYEEYIALSNDDCPLGLYDSQFAQDPASLTYVLSEEYSVPKYFDGIDLFAHLPEDRRPPWRWVLVGTGRSGTELHIDPLYTSAWVSLLEGRKRWCFFPPGTDTDLLGGLSGGSKPALSAVEWYLRFYETAEAEGLGCITILQEPGETVFVPAGWAHVVINLEVTVAITHNYADRMHVREIWDMCLAEERQLLPDVAAHLTKEEREAIGEAKLSAGTRRVLEQVS